MEYLTLEKIEAYRQAYFIGNEIWGMVHTWDKFAKWTLGIQMTRAADSISANIAEGHGRYFKKEKIRFFRYSLGSMYETKDWLLKGKDRQIISLQEAESLIREIDKLPKMINGLINYTSSKLKQ